MNTRERSGDGLAGSATVTGPVTYHEGSGTYRTAFGPETRLATEAVTLAVAGASDTDVLELPPLASTIDPDALDALFGLAGWSPPGTDVTLSFHYAGHEVTVESHGTVRVAQTAPQ